MKREKNPFFAIGKKKLGLLFSYWSGTLVSSKTCYFHLFCNFKKKLQKRSNENIGKNGKTINFTLNKDRVVWIWYRLFSKYTSWSVDGNEVTETGKLDSKGFKMVLIISSCCSGFSSMTDVEFSSSFSKDSKDSVDWFGTKSCPGTRSKAILDRKLIG